MAGQQMKPEDFSSSLRFEKTWNLVCSLFFFIVGAGLFVFYLIYKTKLLNRRVHLKKTYQIDFIQTMQELQDVALEALNANSRRSRPPIPFDSGH